jgi:hypothetical protein
MGRTWDPAWGIVPSHDSYGKPFFDTHNVPRDKGRDAHDGDSGWDIPILRFLRHVPEHTCR